jgi:hypothetical protein
MRRTQAILLALVTPLMLTACGGQHLSQEESLDLVECSPKVAGPSGVVPRKICEERGGLALTGVPHGRNQGTL